MAPTPTTPPTTVTTFNTHLTTLLETLADLDRDIANLSHHAHTNPSILIPSPPASLSSPTPPPSSSPPTTPRSLRKVQALRTTARSIAARLNAFEKDLQAAEKRAKELKEKYHRADEPDEAMVMVFGQVFEGLEMCGRGFSELKGWWVGVVREGSGAGVWAGAPF
ncbi:uncharacterized protein H6S33_010782 [Morchella sextelata]|uniref:uncharacterized protein n=1 Tax=Morchella sextelata TaxID=1174677 RepID=UPI001D041DE2|nr:uncharacterized protein H6S33_010782 [Morchella sextelata]KAH0611517.1 hypothetical protein H6S33_010782 [Morchella sextelata]